MTSSIFGWFIISLFITAVYIGPSPIIPRSEKHFFTPATAQDNANPIQSLPHETISTLHKQTGNAPTLFHIEDSRGQKQ